MLKTVSLRQLRRSVTEAAQDSECAYPRGVVRPITRADCAGGQRPCPFVSCKFHLKLDVAQATAWMLRGSTATSLTPAMAASDRVDAVAAGAVRAEAPNGVFI